MDTTKDESPSAPRRFRLVRDADVSGVSGVGIVAYGVEWSDGQAVLRWCAFLRSTAVYNDVDELMRIHGHEGATRLEWLDSTTGKKVLNIQYTNRESGFFEE